MLKSRICVSPPLPFPSILNEPKVGFHRLHSHWPIRSFTAVQPALLFSPE